jgi:hypothetical protein
VDLYRLLDAVEHPADWRRFVRAGQLCDVLVAHGEHVELGPQVLQHAREPRREVGCARREVLRNVWFENLTQRRYVALGRKAEAVERDDGLQVVVEQRREDRILEAADDHGFVDECVVFAAQTAEGLAQRRPRGALAGGHDENLEVGLAALPAAQCRRQDRVGANLGFVVLRPGVDVVAVTVRQQCGADLLHQSSGARVISLVEPFVHERHDMRSGVAVELLDGSDLVENGGGVRAQAICVLRIARRDRLDRAM